MTNGIFRLVLVITILSLAPTAATADPACDAALAEVHAAGTAAGPYRATITGMFFRDGKASGSMNAIHDAILPDRFRRILINNRGRFTGTLIIGDKGWNETLGTPRTVMAPKLVKNLMRTFQMENPFALQGAANVACSTGPDRDGKQVVTFTWSQANGPSAANDSVVADAQSKLPLRLHREQLFEGKIEAAFDTVLRFDPLITIDPPAP